MQRLYQICDGYVHRKIADVDVLISIGENLADFNGYTTLNETASFLWDQLKTPKTPEQLASLLEAEFSVDHETALTDTLELLETMVSEGMAREVTG